VFLPEGQHGVQQGLGLGGLGAVAEDVQDARPGRLAKAAVFGGVAGVTMAMASMPRRCRFSRSASAST
jgi:hypothetical protein